MAITKHISLFFVVLTACAAPAGGHGDELAQVAGGGTGDGIVARPAVTASQVFIGAENQTLSAFALR